MPVQYKDIDDLVQRQQATGAEKVPVSATEYITAQQVADLAPVPTQLSQLAGDATHRTVTDAQIGTWDGKYDIPAGGIPAEDLDSDVQAALVDAETAYQKPADGIPATDLDEDVQASLDAADTAYQKPSGGIPAADLAAGVIPDVSGKADKVAGAAAGNLAGLDASGNFTDSGSKPSDFATAAQGAKADTAVQPGDLPAYPVVEALTTAEIDTIWNAAMA